MAWPTPQDYNEAVQNPRHCFSDPDLRQGTPLLTPLGLPKPITGAFASVYQVNSNTRRWAVRCFQHEYADQERRYSEISKHLKQANLKCMVDFEYLARGILVRGTWYPVLKMEWIDGVPLADYLGRNLGQRQTFQEMSRQWFDLMASLKGSGIAHGDLQHGNVLVKDRALKLIDYDAMYVPGLAGRSSHEVGHRNYQHPKRTGYDFHADLDNFSAWVIHTSISALAIDASFWKRLNAGDECLLFRREDFERPKSSKAFQALEQHASTDLKALTSRFRSIVTLPIAEVPLLDGTAIGRSPGPEPGGRGTWIIDHLPKRIQHQKDSTTSPEVP